MGTQVSGTEVATNVPVTPEPTPTATVDAIAATLVSEKPAPSEHAIAAAQAEAAANEGKDAAGERFNPAIHAVNADGSPRKTVGGRYALKRGKKAGSTQAPPSTIKGVVIPPGVAGAGTTPSLKEQQARLGGVQATGLLFMLCIGMGGQEWQPRKDDKTGLDEKLMMETAMGDFFVAHDWEDLPPGLALCVAFGMYAMPRFQMPQTRTRAQRFKAWLGAKIGAWRANRKAKRRGLPESDVERADREARELYAREKAGKPGETVEVGAR